MKKLKPAPGYFIKNSTNPLVAAGFKKGGIHIKEKNKGKFTASAKAAGHSVQQHAKAVLANPNATPLQKKRANFARNAAKWHHQNGGIGPGINTDPKQRFGAGSDELITRDIWNQYEAGTLPIEHPLMNMVSGQRRQLRTAFQDPNLSEVSASTMNLAYMPKQTINGKPDPYGGSLGDNTTQFYLTGQKYNKPAAVPAVQQDTLQTPVPLALQPAPVVPKALPPNPSPTRYIGPSNKSNKKFKATDPYAAYPKRYRRKMGYEIGGIHLSPETAEGYVPGDATAMKLQHGFQKGGVLPASRNFPSMSVEARQKAIYEPDPLKMAALRVYEKNTPPSGVSQKVFDAHTAVSKHTPRMTFTKLTPAKKKLQDGGYTDMNITSAQHMQANTYPVKKKKNTSLKKGFAAGGTWGAGGAGASGAAALGSTAGSFVSGLGADKYGVTSTGAAIGGGALSGAALGTTILPGWGTLIGAVIGGAVGGIKNKIAKNKREKALEGIARAQNVQNANQSETALANYDNQGTGVRSFAHGGSHPHGGLRPIIPMKQVNGKWLVSAPGGYGNDGGYHFTDRSFLVERDQNNKKLKAYQGGGAMAGAAMSGVSQMVQPLLPEDIEAKRARAASLLAQGRNSGFGGEDWAHAHGFQNGGMNVNGGDLKPISDNAYEVDGDNPQATDDVQFEDAYVDHGEVMKPAPEGTRIFSNHLTLPGTKTTFAKAAKKLEKSKALKGNPNPNQDALIESKLKALFHTQQRINGDSQGESTEEAIQPAGEVPGRGMTEGNMFKMGGLSPRNVSYHEMTPRRIGSLAKEAMATNVISKKYYHSGGTMAEKLFEVPGFKKELRTEPGHGKGSATFQGGGLAPSYNVNQTGKNYLGWGSYKPITNPVPTGQPAAGGGGSNINWSAVAGLGASLAGNVHNAMALKNMPDVAQVSLTKAPRLRRLDYSDQKAMLKEGLNTAIKAGNRNSTMRQAQEGSQAASLAEYSRATNQMHGDVNRTNAQIGNEEAAMGWRNNLMNNQLTNQYRQDQQQRLSAIMSGESANIADVGNKIQGFVAQSNAMKLDQQKLNMNLAQLELAAPGAGYRHLIANGYTPEQAQLMMAEAATTMSGQTTPQGKRNGGFVPTKKPLSYKMGGRLRRVC